MPLWIYIEDTKCRIGREKLHCSLWKKVCKSFIPKRIVFISRLILNRKITDLSPRQKDQLLSLQEDWNIPQLLFFK